LINDKLGICLIVRSPNLLLFILNTSIDKSHAAEFVKNKLQR